MYWLRSVSRNSKCGQAMPTLLLIAIMATASSGQLHPPSFFRRSLLANPAAPGQTKSKKYRPTDFPATFSGLQDTAPTGDSTNVLHGHYLTESGLTGGQNGLSDSGSAGTWGQQIYYGKGAKVKAHSNGKIGITLETAKRNLIWMLNATSGAAYQISTTSIGTGSVSGIFLTSPGAAENPVLVTVDSGGNAWVANLNTVGQTVGSVVKIKNMCTGIAGTHYSNGPNALLSWNKNSASSMDNCVVQYTTLTDNTLTITAIATDSSDDLWVLAGNSFTGSASTNFLNIYKVSSTGSTATLMYGPLIVPDGKFGNPGGNGAVVDAAGFLWTGSGSFQYADNGDGSSRTHSIMRFDTSVSTANDASKPILAFTMPDEATMLDLDSDSNIWVAGGAYVTKVFTSQIAVTDSSIPAKLDGGTISISLSTSSVHAPISINLATNVGSACTDPTDGCCTSGNFDAGIVFVTAYNTIYAANACRTGLVFPITNSGGTATPTLGTVIPVGSYLQAIVDDSSSNVWVAGSTLTETSITNSLFVVTNANGVNTVMGPTYATGRRRLSGVDESGSTETAVVTYIHDTGIPDYSKWEGGTIGWTFAEYGTVDGTPDGTPMYTMTAQVGNSLSALKAANNPLPYKPVLDAPIPFDTLGTGRYLRLDVQLQVIAGEAPTITEIRLQAYNHEPSAICKSVYISATDDTTANGGLGSSATNKFAIDSVVGSAVAGVCTQGAPITIDDGSFDSDTQEADLVITSATTIGYNFTTYTNTLPTWALQITYSSSQLTVYDSHNSQATCNATVAIWDDTKPTYLPTFSADSAAAPALCTWPPNINYWCILDVFAQSGGRFLRTSILPVRDNCAAVDGFAMTVDAARATAGATPTLSSGAGFACTDTDLRSQLGDCTIVQDGSKYNFCVKAHRRTVFTNLDRVFTMQFLVQDAGTLQGLNSGTLFSRSLRIPPIWMFQPAMSCPRATYARPASTRLSSPTACSDASSTDSIRCAAVAAALSKQCEWNSTTSTCL